MAVLLLAVTVVVASSVCVWANWYITWSNAGPVISITRIDNSYDDLMVWVQNIGKGSLQLAEDGCLYVNGELVECTISDVTVSDRVATLGEWKTATLKYVGGAVLPGLEVTVNVTSLLGTSAEKAEYPAGTKRAARVFDHLEFDPIASPQISGVPFTVTLRAFDQYGEPFLYYTDINTLTCSECTISPAMTGSFVDGVWTGEVTVAGSADDATITNRFLLSGSSQHRTSSNTFDVETLIEPPSIHWCKTYGGNSNEKAYSLVVTSDGGYALAGSGLLVKTDSSGNEEWNKTIEAAASSSLVITPDGGYAMVGTHTERVGDEYNYYEQNDAQLVKTTASGNVLWTKKYGDYGHDGAAALVVTSDKGFAVGGNTNSFGLGRQSIWLIKTDRNGNAQWNKTYGGGSCTSLVATSDGGYALACTADSVILLIKTDEDGNMEWNRTYDGPGYNAPRSLIETSDGGYAILGLAGAYQDEDGWLIKTDSSGNVEWSQTYGDGQLNDLIETSDGGYAMAGYTGPYGSDDFWLVKTDSSGNMEWSQAYQGPKYERAYGLVEASDGSFVLAGFTNPPDTEQESFFFWGYSGSSEDFWLVKTDEYGNTN